VLLSPDVLAKVSSLVTVEDFTHPGHRAVWEAVLELDRNREPIEPSAAWRVLEQRGIASKLSAFGGREFLDVLAATPVTVETAPRKAQRVAAKADRRRALESLAALLEDGYDVETSDDDFARSIEARLLAITNARRTGSTSRSLREIMRANLIALGERWERSRNGGEALAGVETPFPTLNHVTGGLQAGQFIVVAARPRMGKTALMLNVIEHAARMGTPCFVVSAEMTGESLGERLLSSESGVDSTLLRIGRLDQQKFVAISNAAIRLADLPVEIDDTSGISIGEVRSRVRRWRATAAKNSDRALVVVDYLQLLGDDYDVKSTKGLNREREVARISGGLKALAKECKLPVIALAQLNRELESREDKRPKLSDIRESGAIEQDADIVLSLYRDDVYDRRPDNPHRGTAELSILKQRDGNEALIWLDWDARRVRFVERSEPPPPKNAARANGTTRRTGGGAHWMDDQ
jgi:replicative DNA helicase